MKSVGEILLQEVEGVRNKGLLETAPRQNEVEYAFMLANLGHNGAHSTILDHARNSQSALHIAIRVVHCGLAATYISGNPIEALIDWTNKLIEARRWCVESVASVVVERKKPPFPWKHNELTQVSGWAAQLELWEQFHQLVDHMYLQ